ncbi:hypothetical protein DL98DRAFT_39072 [Cadophora sp. DSE1049]|nr:hypothetical protein DL98DRAFT_39072 [Cadophora sp. DSE1049]
MSLMFVASIAWWISESVCLFIRAPDGCGYLDVGRIPELFFLGSSRCSSDGWSSGGGAGFLRLIIPLVRMHSCSFTIPYICVIGGGCPGGTFWQVSLFYGDSKAAGVLAYLFESRLFGHCSGKEKTFDLLQYRLSVLLL